jgi:predicted nuclease of predicted toxin-antitoxin system
VKFLIDNNLSLLAESLRATGHDAIHLRDINMHDVPDPAVLEYARSEECVLILADTDFGALLTQQSHKLDFGMSQALDTRSPPGVARPSGYAGRILAARRRRRICLPALWVYHEL